jgi:hypothetical protein
MDGATHLAQGSLGGARVEGVAVGVGVATVGVCVGVAVGTELNVATSSGTSTASHHRLSSLRWDATTARGRKARSR